MHFISSLWNETDPDASSSELAQRVYSSRLLGRDDTLVLHGGGNTSVKLRESNVLGDLEEILYVKGSGSDLVSIEERGFAPVRLNHLIRLADLDRLSDPQMMNELATQTTRAGAPKPSVEAILHAILPYRYVDHTHADAVLAITNTRDGAARVRAIYGSDVVVIPYVMPGFDLARACRRAFAEQAHAGTLGMVLLNHGIFSFGASARESYERMIALVRRAEAYLDANGAWDVAPPPIERSARALRRELAELRRRVSRAAGFPILLQSSRDPESLAFARRDDVATLSQEGPVTPDHVLRTKRLPLVGRDVEAYEAAYRAYFQRNAPRAREPKTMLDAAPRVLLDRELGLVCAGRGAREAAIVRDLYAHTISVILRAHALGGYAALPEADIFDVEYWDLEQQKLKGAGAPPMFAGEVALVTGAASGIGRACVAALLKRGAAVVGVDRDPGILELHRGPDYLGVQADVRSAASVVEALERAAERFGGLDMLVLNAGVFPGARRIEALDTEEWRQVMEVNLDANLAFMRECHPLLALAPNGGRVVVVGSKNVPAPGPGAAAYSASKAALTQLARVAALEWGSQGIRVNLVHPNQVFDTGLWTDEVLASRAASYGMSIAEYRTHNVLQAEVTSRDVAELVAELCGPLFAKTTGAQIPVDGGNERVI
jgi:rhamnose utilization protein RhaD (predicted bifunctional aldolase and dehydrogenase)/NAD(P)-dependent dehydrogenase (short-subunit alcohol dehydrogenase family)